MLITSRDDTGHSSHDDMDINAHLLRLYAIRDRTFGNTKGARRRKLSPIGSREQLLALKKELVVFKPSLSPDLLLSGERLAIMADSRDASDYFMLHSICLQGYLDLDRFLIPGIRGAANREAINATPAEYVDYCQSQCLRRVSQMVDVWYRISHLRLKGSTDDLSFGFSTYQVSQISYCLPHPLQVIPDGVDGIQRKLSKALELGSSSLHSRFIRMGDCLVDRFGQTRGVSPAPATRSSSRDHHHMPSRGSFIPRESAESEAQDKDITTDEAQKTYVRAVDDVTASYGGNPTTAIVLPVFDSWTLTFDGMRNGFMPWDPSDMHVNDYCDPDLRALGIQY